jgi:hypothetical protein
MKTVSVERIKFSFEEDWNVSKYDDWAYYKKKFQSIRNGVKAVDLIAMSSDKLLYLVEVKDYRAHIRTKPSELSEDVTCKVFDTLAALLPAKCKALDCKESDFAKQALTSNGLRVILHIEQPAKHSKLFPRAIDPSSVQIKLRQALRAVDPHAKVVHKNSQALPWRVNC